METILYPAYQVLFYSCENAYGKVEKILSSPFNFFTLTYEQQIMYEDFNFLRDLTRIQALWIKAVVNTTRLVLPELYQPYNKKYVAFLTDLYEDNLPKPLHPFLNTQESDSNPNIDKINTTYSSQPNVNQTIRTAVLDKYNKATDLVLYKLTTYLKDAISNYIFENTSLDNQIDSISENLFGAHFIDEGDMTELQNEIEDNLLNATRDGAEFNYLRRIDNLFEKFDIVEEFLQTDIWLRAETELLHTSISSADAVRRLKNHIKSFGDGLLYVRVNALEPIRNSLLFHQNRAHFPNCELFKENSVSTSTLTDQELEPTEPGKGLSAAQKLLLIRLLQKECLFPQKPGNTDDAPELRAIALLTGLSYENQIKGSKGANAKVNQLLNDRERKAMTIEQAKPKLKDIDAVEEVAKLLNVDSVVVQINQYRKDLKKIIHD